MAWSCPSLSPVSTVHCPAPFKPLPVISQPTTVAKETSRYRPEKRYWRLRRLESAVPAQLALKNVTLRKGRDTLCKVRQSGTCCAEREQPICTASRWQLMESLSGTAVSSTVAIVGSIWPKGPAQAGPAIQAQWIEEARTGRIISSESTRNVTGSFSDLLIA